MWRLVTRWVPRCDGSAETGQAAETESGEGDGRADCEAGGVGSEEEGGVRVGAWKIKERGDGGCEAYEVAMMGSSLRALPSSRVRCIMFPTI